MTRKRALARWVSSGPARGGVPLGWVHDGRSPVGLGLQ
jgi:hypothetical protein